MSSARIIFSLPRRSAVRVHSPAWRSARTSHFVVQKGPSLMRRAQTRRIVSQVRLQVWRRARNTLSLPCRIAVRVLFPTWRCARTRHVVVQKGPSLMRRAQNLRSFARHIVPQVRLQCGGVLGSSSPCHVALPYKFASQHGSRSSDLLGMEACVTCSIMSTNLRLTLSCDEQIGNGCRPSSRCFKTMQSPIMMPTIPHQLAPNTEPTSTCGCDIAQDSIFLCGWTSCPLVIKKQSSFHLPLRVTQKGKTRRRTGTSTRPSATRCVPSSITTPWNEDINWVRQVSALSCWRRVLKSCQRPLKERTRLMCLVATYGTYSWKRQPSGKHSCQTNLILNDKPRVFPARQKKRVVGRQRSSLKEN